MEVAISKVIRKKFKYTNNEEIVDILSFISDKCMKSKGILIESTGKLSFKIQKGGKKKLIKLEDDKVYEYHVDGITPLDDNQKQLNFMNLTENHDNCVCLYFDRKKNKNSEDNSLIIQSLMNDEDCVKSEDKSHKYKVGDILMQIIIKLVQVEEPFNHIKQIEVSDVSKKKCYKLGLELIYLRTITHGIPYYAKFGFRPKNILDYEVFKYNRNNYKLNKSIKNEELFNIIRESRLSKKTEDIYKKYFYDYIKNTININPIILLRDMINSIDLTNNVDEKKEICNFINVIYKKIYKILGYKEYEDRIWILKIRE